MDLQMPEMNGLDALIAIRNEFPDAKVIVLTTYAGDVQILRALKAGAQAYLLKNTLHKELLETIRAVHAGKKALSPEASYEVAEHATDDALTPAEIAVLRLIAAGNANKQIADQLSITEETVKSRVKTILSKLGANDRTHAAMIGLKRGIIELVVFASLPPRPPALAKLERVTIPTSFWGFDLPSQCHILVTSGRVRIATFIFHIRWRLAWHRFASHALGCRLRTDCARGLAVVGRSSAKHHSNCPQSCW